MPAETDNVQYVDGIKHIDGVPEHLYDVYFHSDETAQRTVDEITGHFTGGDLPVGEPGYRNGDVVAYSPKQAKTIFENLMAARVDDQIIPFLTINDPDGFCVDRKDMMVRHMMYHQHISPEAIGVATSKLHKIEKNNIADYERRIRNALGKADETVDYNEGFIPGAYVCHVAPTIRVFKDGEISDLVLDPAICSNPAPIPVWANAQRQGVSVCHFLLNHVTDCRVVLGEMVASDINEYALRKPKPASTPAQLFENAKSREYDGFNTIMYQRSYIEESCENLTKDGKRQSALQQLAAEHGCGELPNCGPRALKAVHTALKQR